MLKINNLNAKIENKSMRVARAPVAGWRCKFVFTFIRAFHTVEFKGLAITSLYFENGAPPGLGF